MTSTTVRPQWRRRLAQIRSQVDEISIPEVASREMPQDREWCDVVVAGKRKRIRFHDYHEIYCIPGLYEKLFYENLGCCSPSRVVQLLEELLVDFGDDSLGLKVLDLGAGNGMVGDELHARQVQRIVGIDLLPEAKEAARRDRPEVYHNYLAVDLTDLPKEVEEYLRGQRFNCLITVAALGFNDVPPAAFIKALDLVETRSWVALTLKEDFLREQDDSGFATLIRQLSRDEIIQIQAYRRFRHRFSITGEPLFYIAMVARKLAEVPDALIQRQPRHLSFFLRRFERGAQPRWE
jgi:SAM-dependent methyltransferase